MLYATTFYFLAGAITGTVFKTRTLLILLGLVLIESVILALVHSSIPWLWAVENLTIVQVGYLAGLYGRRNLEQAGYLLPPVRPPRMR